jgi:hypothetical protein
LLTKLVYATLQPTACTGRCVVSRRQLIVEVSSSIGFCQALGELWIGIACGDLDDQAALDLIYGNRPGKRMENGLVHGDRDEFG